MRKWLILLGISAILIVGGYVVLSYYGVKLIQAQLQKAIGPGFTISEIKIKPTHLSAGGIRYEDPHSKQRFFQLEEIRVYPSLFSFLHGPLQIREMTILKPSFFFYRSREGVFIGPWGSMEKQQKGKEMTAEGEGKEREPIHVEIGRFRLQKGSIHFEDRKASDPPAQIRLKDLDVEIKDIRYPVLSSHSSIELKGNIEGKKKAGSLSALGWIDLKTMDMDTVLKIHEMEVKAFEPYYRKRVSAEIEEGYMDIEAKIAIKGRVMDVPGELGLIDLHIKEGEGTVFWIPAKTLAPLLQKKGNRLKIPFHIKGNIDDPQFSLQEAFLTRVAFSVAEALGFPIKGVAGPIPGGTGKGDEALAEGVKVIEELFGKKREKKR